MSEYICSWHLHETLLEPGNTLISIFTNIIVYAIQLGEVERMTVFSKHADGVIMVRYKSAGAAAAALSAFDKRFFGGRQLQCNYWDGKTDYRRVLWPRDCSNVRRPLNSLP